jgi:CubicO group peptidase (beta-lactamase class C family)
VEVGARIVGADTVVVDRGGPARPLPSADVDPATVASLPVVTRRDAGADGTATVEELLVRHAARSLVVLHHGRVAFEWHRPGGGPDRAYRCYSLTKSFTGTLAALTMADGRLDPDARVGALVPELDASGFTDATVRDLADMTASIGYDEDYSTAGDIPTGGGVLGFDDYLLALGLALPDADLPADAPRAIRPFLARVGAGAHPHGEVFTYATPVTDALGWVLERVTGTGYADLLGAALWSRLGAEHDAVLSLDPTGTPLAGGGLALTTRDLARFGLLLAEGGTRRDLTGPDAAGAGGAAEPTVPAPVIETIRDGGDPAAFARGHYDDLTGYTYRDQWWLPGGSSRPLSAWGIHGQLLWVEPDHDLVIAVHAAGAEASDVQRDLEQDALCRALVAASADWPG